MAEQFMSGKIIAVLQPREGKSQRTGNAWKVQEFVLETDGQFPKHLCFEVFGDENLTKFNIQQNGNYTVHFDIDAHEYQGRWFNQIRAWKVETYLPSAPTSSASAPAPQQSAPTPNSAPAPQPLFQNEEKNSDLPF